MTSAIKQDKWVKTFLREQLSEYLRTIGYITSEEKKDLLEWVKDGNSVYDNPFLMSDDNGYPMDYIEACRATADMAEAMMKPDFVRVPSDSRVMDSPDGEPF